MATVVEVQINKPAVKGATLTFDRNELDYLRIALVEAYRANQPTSFPGVQHKLYKTIDETFKGDSAAPTKIATRADF